MIARGNPQLGNKNFGVNNQPDLAKFLTNSKISKFPVVDVFDAKRSN
jgi:hypothetical protein